MRRITRQRRIAVQLAATALVAASGCSLSDRVVKPDGAGGWSPEARRAEIRQRAVAARVDVPQGDTPSAPAVASGAPLDLADVLSEALTNNRRVAEGRTRLAIAEAQTREARGRLLPSTVGSGRYTWASDPQTNQISFPAGILPPGTTVPPITIREQDFGTVNATLTLPIDLSGELLQALSAAQAGYRGERARLWATTLEQQTTAVRAYFQLLEAQALRRVTEQTIALDRQQVATAEARFLNGRVTKNDLLVVQVALRNAEQQLAQRDLALRQARRLLNDTIGRPIDAPTEVVDVSQTPTLPGAEESLRRSYESNPLLQALLEERQRLEASASSLRRSRLPRFNVGGAVDYSSTTIVDPQTIGSGFTGFIWDLGTDTRREAQIAQAEQAIEQSRTSLERQLRELEEGVRNVREAAAERLLALATAQDAVIQAEENLRIRQQQFDAGRAQSDDVLLAETLLAQQRATVATALYQAHIRRVELQQLIGQPLEEAIPASR